MNGTGARAAYLAGAAQAAGFTLPAHVLERPDMRNLSDNELERRRTDLHVELARVNDELQRRGRTRNARLAAARIAATEHMADAARPLDCSDTGIADDCYPFP